MLLLFLLLLALPPSSSLQVMSAAFSPDGGRAVTASKDGTLRIWNTAVRYQLQVREVLCCCGRGWVSECWQRSVHDRVALAFCQAANVMCSWLR